jgi:aminocarboxymuconate-semialdehyde decarboxylase
MTVPYPLKIDAYAHIVPPKFRETLYKIDPKGHDRLVLPNQALWDLERRFRILDKYEPIRQVLSLGRIAVEHVAGPEKSAELARQANDELAELVVKHRDRFCGAVGTLPMNNIDASLKEAERCIKDLKMRGVYIHTPVDEKPLDNAEFWPLYAMMEDADLPIVIHPMRKEDHPDYLTEKLSKYYIFSLFGWPYDTTTAMARLVFSGVMQKYPNLKILTHHLGGMIPFYSERIKQFTQSRMPPGLKKDCIDYFKMFYADTGIYGNPSALKCGWDFFGKDHIVFGIDFPLGDIEHGTRNYRQTINAIEEMGITEAEKKMIYEDNATKLMHLPV